VQSLINDKTMSCLLNENVHIHEPTRGCGNGSSSIKGNVQKKREHSAYTIGVVSAYLIVCSPAKNSRGS